MVKGLYFEELALDWVVSTKGRTITEADIVRFAGISGDFNPLHVDSDFASKTEFGQPLVNSIFTLGLMIGMSVTDTTLGTTIGNLAMTDVNFPNPVFHGDTLRVRTTVRSKRESKSRPNDGIVVFYHEAFKQDDTLVANCVRTALMRKKPA